MINQNDLRIGNYINSKLLGSNHKITGLLSNMLYTDLQLSYSDYADWQPIPLTVEILDKINWGGYIKFNIGSYFKIDDVGHLYYRSDYSGVNIDYLHQLQNFYYLLRGIELEIVW